MLKTRLENGVACQDRISINDTFICGVADRPKVAPAAHMRHFDANFLQTLKNFWSPAALHCFLDFSSVSSFCSASIFACWLSSCRSSWRCCSWIARSE